MRSLAKCFPSFLLSVVVFLCVFSLSLPPAEAQTDDQNAVKAMLANALTAYNDKDVDTLMSYFSPSYLDEGKTYAIQREEFIAEFAGTISPLPTVAENIVVTGNTATAYVPGGPGKFYLINDGENWLIYGNQQKYGVRAFSGHEAASSNPNSYWVELMVEDPADTIQGVSVTGPGITGALALNHEPENHRWVSWGQGPSSNVAFGNTLPSGLPFTYSFTITDGSGPFVQTSQVHQFVTVYPASTTPAANAILKSAPTFTWSPVSGPYTYGVEIYDAAFNRKWHKFQITGTSVTYDGPPLTGGLYYYNVQVRDEDGNFSLVQLPFSYSGPSVSMFSNDAKLKAATDITTDGITGFYVSGGDGAGTGFDSQEIFKIGMAGGGATVFSAANNPMGITTDGTYIYWIDPNGDPDATAIFRKPIAGGEREKIYSGFATGEPVVDGSGIEFVPGSGSPGTLVTADEVQGRIHKMTATNAVTGITQLGGNRFSGYFDREHASFVAIDGETVYVADTGRSGYSDTPPRIQSITLSGGTFTDLYVGALPDFSPWGIAVHDGTIYMTSGNRVLKMPATGGTPELVVSDPRFVSLQGLTYYNHALYVLDNTGSQAVVWKVAFVVNLTVSVTGTGMGAVTGAGLTCAGGSCGGTYATGTEVLLTASPEADGTFGGWTGCDGVNGNQCTVAMNADRNVSVVFNDRYGVGATTGHFPGDYTVALSVVDPGEAEGMAASVSVTGPGITDALALEYDVSSRSWVVPGDRKVHLGADVPVTPLAYAFTIIRKAGGTVAKQLQVTDFVQGFITDPLPVEAQKVTGALTFSWTGLAGTGYDYGVELYDAGGAPIWSKYGLTSASVAYDGVPLAKGGYSYHVHARDTQGNFSQITTHFTYDPETLSPPWVTKASMAAARSQTVGDAIDGILYLAGGWDGHDTPTLQAYNPTANTWSTLASMPGGRYGSSGAAVMDGKLYVPGGWTTSPGLPNGNLYVYDPQTNAWTEKAPLPNSRRTACGAAGVINGKMYMTTACDGYNGYRNFLDVYDPATDIWSSLPASQSAHGYPAWGVNDNKLYVAGGHTDNGNTGNTLEVYDPVTNTWATKAPLPVAGVGFASGVIDGKLYVTGGTDAQSNILSDLFIYDPASNTWSKDTAALMPTPRLHSASGVINGILYVAGGQNPAISPSPLDVVEAYKPPAADSGLVAYYPFNGNANDGSGNGRHGVVYNAVLTADRFGNAGRAYSFGAPNSYVEVPNTKNLKFNTFSLLAWIRILTDTVNEEMLIVGQHVCGYDNG